MPIVIPVAGRLPQQVSQTAAPTSVRASGSARTGRSEPFANPRRLAIHRRRMEWQAFGSPVPVFVASFVLFPVQLARDCV